MISFVFYFVISHNKIILSWNFTEIEEVYQMIIELVIFMLCMDSIIDYIVIQETKKHREIKVKFIENQKKLAHQQKAQT